MIRFYILLSLGILTGLTVSAQTGTLQGKIKSEGKLIAGATLHLAGPWNPLPLN